MQTLFFLFKKQNVDSEPAAEKISTNNTHAYINALERGGYTQADNFILTS